MAASTEDYGQEYQEAYKAYMQGNYEEAATRVDRVVENSPNDPSIHLLRGHVYYVLQQYDVAREEYQTVLNLTEDPELINFANNGLDYINQYQQQNGDNGGASQNREQADYSPDFTDPVEDYSPGLVDPLEDYSPDFTDSLGTTSSPQEDLETLDFNANNFDFSSFDDDSSVSSGATADPPFGNPFGTSNNSNADDTTAELPGGFSDPFALDEEIDTPVTNTTNSWEEQSSESADFWQEEMPSANFEAAGFNGTASETDNEAFSDYNSGSAWNYSNDSTFEDSELPPSNNFDNQSFIIEVGPSDRNEGSFNFKQPTTDDETLLMGEEPSSNIESRESNFGYSQEQFSQPDSVANSFSFEQDDRNLSSSGEQNGFREDSFDFDSFDTAFADVPSSIDDDSSKLGGGITASNVEFLDDFDEFDDLGNIPGFDTAEDPSMGDAALNADSLGVNGRSRQTVVERLPDSEDREDELFSITGSQEAVPAFTQVDGTKTEPVVTVEQGWLASFENATLERKQWISAAVVGAASALVVAAVSFAAATFSPPQQREAVRNTGWAMALASGIAGFATSAAMSKTTIKQIRRTTDDLKTQFEAVRDGNLNAQATVYSEDEFGQLAAGFNEMSRVILTTTSEAQRKAQEQEEAKENLQRQVIRLLDDVEGAARGDLTVQAEVTADVLGAVADAFNLTIQNLRDIVQQVKTAAREVTKGATNSETFARALSSDALRQAEELAVTLNSVQVMTDTIQRVAESAREAEAVARSAAAIAVKGGEAVERTVEGILEVRETVAETSRKVKRLAESSQEISKIVALISQIASRTNLLALNASIEAARAGEAGRGFAIVADEVRQLADKSAKSLKEIEQIVMQIQSETNSVMTAMEEGTQQVLKGTHLAEQAKRSLENIIQEANRIDALVRSIAGDTVEQTETSRAVASVMQSVELTAQETSQEAQRVSGALQSLVGVSRDLLSSVERFRVETTESR